MEVSMGKIIYNWGDVPLKDGGFPEEVHIIRKDGGAALPILRRLGVCGSRKLQKPSENPTSKTGQSEKILGFQD